LLIVRLAARIGEFAGFDRYSDYRSVLLARNLCVVTAQQLQIAHCVAHGATNREVAAQLFLSPRTVDHHLRNIYTKLGIRSRVDLVRLLG
jgi:DNA-binding CsgD family transcriptional regulator